MNDLDTPTGLIRIKIQSKLKKKYIQIALCFFIIPVLPNTHLLMRIPFLKIFAVSWVSPNS